MTTSVRKRHKLTPEQLEFMVARLCTMMKKPRTTSGTKRYYGSAARRRQRGGEPTLIRDLMRVWLDPSAGVVPLVRSDKKA